MTDCPDGLMRDLLPGYALGVLDDAELARVAAHVTSCAACQTEVALLKRARASFALGVPRMDVAAIVSALPAPETSPRPMRAPSRWRVERHVWQFATAAGLVLVVGGGLLLRREGAVPSTPLGDTTQVASTPAESAAVAPAGTVDTGISFGGGLSDLSLEDLQALLGQMDSLKTLPSADPESMTPVIEMNEGGKTL